MKYILVFFIIILSAAKVFAEYEFQTLYVNTFFNPNIIQIENSFKNILKEYPETTAYTRVPRGLIISIRESELFNNGDYKIKQSGYKILDSIASVLEQFENRCVIESHSDEPISETSDYREDWEITIMRANEITDYLTKCRKIKRDRVFPLGFGEIMPFKENVSRTGFNDSRIDFVVIDYEYKR